ncbi:MAG: dephospho-CoA kinase [Acidimicrobiia bacterium]
MTSAGSLHYRTAARVLLGGGIGAGKSAVAVIFERAGFLVIEADEIGRSLLAAGTPEAAAVQELWPSVVAEGVVDRAALATIVFGDASELRKLEAVTHPAIAAEIERRVAKTEKDVVVEAPLAHLEISGEWTRVAVVADSRERLARAVARGGDPDDVKRRMKSQMSTAEWMSWADVVIDNNGSWAETEAHVAAVIDERRG